MLRSTPARSSSRSAGADDSMLTLKAKLSGSGCHSRQGECCGRGTRIRSTQLSTQSSGRWGGGCKSGSCSWRGEEHPMKANGVG